MAHRVVEQLEIVQVEIEQRAAVPRAPAARQHVFQFLDQETTVGQARQVIEIRQFVDVALGALAFGKIGVGV